ncbi:MAG TPA: hypothetical protein VGR28_11310 [Candidatus Thermoplasmatota archaeon]|jgi:hypothetical protein|nr:hypothetical protein [Candidatus Thermoplasmatota archaeon]
MLSKLQKGLAAAAVLSLVGAMGAASLAGATHSPADKIQVSGSALEVMHASAAAPGGDAINAVLGGLGGPGVLDDPTSEEVSLLSATLRTAVPTDLLFRVSAECALWTNITTVGNDDSEAEATVKVWVELDGNPVAVSGDDTNEAGKVVFCNRAFRMMTEMFDDEDATIHSYLRSRTANAFEWATLNVGGGIHTIEVVGELSTQVTGTGDAKAAIGKRTLVVEPVKLANDASI